jgi:nicotinamide phosphoribosyltransferase
MTKFIPNFDLILYDTDAYKVSMSAQYPPGTSAVYSYIEARSNQWNMVTWFGLKPILKTLEQVVTAADVEHATKYWNAQGLPFPTDRWMRLVDKFDGKLQLEIKAAPEGTRLKHGNVLATVINTDPDFFWLDSWVETELLRVWYPTTVATLSASIKEIIIDALEETSDDPQGEVAFKLHDFGSRGVPTREVAGIGGSAHLLNFMGTDTGVALGYAMTHYNAPMEGTAASIPAAEHSTITSWGRENEAKAYKNMLDKFGDGLVAVVSDSYNIWNAIDNIWGDELKDRVVNMKGMLVVRPDSGDPTIVPIEVIKRLDAKFGHTVNSKGYKVLNNVRVIQGDGINYDSIQLIIQRLLAAGYSLTNLAFGMGGALLQGVTRDTLGFAMKCSATCGDGGWIDVYKDPIDAPGKRSKRGKLALIEVKGVGFMTVREDKLDGRKDVLRTVYLNGEVVTDEQWVDICARAAM